MTIRWTKCKYWTRNGYYFDIINRLRILSFILPKANVLRFLWKFNYIVYIKIQFVVPVRNTRLAKKINDWKPKIATKNHRCGWQGDILRNSQRRSLKLCTEIPTMQLVIFQSNYETLGINHVVTTSSYNYDRMSFVEKEACQLD